MNYSLSRTKTIFSKELKDTLRDRRTIIAMILGPLIVIPLTLFVPFILGVPSAESPMLVGIVNPEEAMSLIQIFDDDESINMKFFDNEEELIRLVNNSKVEIGLVFPEGFEEEMEQVSTNLTMWIYFDSGNMRSATGASVIKSYISNYKSNRIKEHIIEKYNLTDEEADVILNPIDISSIDLSPQADNPIAFMLVFMLPMFLAVWSVTSGMNATIDLTTGEKERKTIESLLTSPATRTEIITGKFFAILCIVMMTLSVMIVLIFVGSMISSNMLESQIEGMSSGLNINIFSILIMIPLLAIFSTFVISIELIVCSYARNFKEASTYISPITMVIIFPAIFTMYMSVNDIIYFTIPVINVISCMKGILVENIGIYEILVTFVSSAIYGVIAIFIATRIFMKEKVLFRS